jgi:hypothetical protein
VAVVVLVELDVDDGVVVEVDVVEEGVVDVVVEAGGEPPLPLLPKNVVPEPAPPKMSDSGFPEISSTAVMKSKASTNTMPAAAAMAFHE